MLQAAQDDAADARSESLSGAMRTGALLQDDLDITQRRASNEADDTQQQMPKGKSSKRRTPKRSASKAAERQLSKSVPGKGIEDTLAAFNRAEAELGASLENEIQIKMGSKRSSQQVERSPGPDVIDTINSKDWERGLSGTLAPMGDKPNLIILKQSMRAALTREQDRTRALHSSLGGQSCVMTKSRAEIAAVVRGLEMKLETEPGPGGGLAEVQMMRRGFLRAQLSLEDPLAQKGVELMDRWERNAGALRAESKLKSAIERAAHGYSERAPDAGICLGKAMVEVRFAGVQSESLERAREVLKNWEDTRLEHARLELTNTLKYNVEWEVKEAVALAQTAGMSPEELAGPIAMLKRLRWEEDINLAIEKAIDGDDFNALEQVVTRAHSLGFTEEESMMLKIASLEVHLVFWDEELERAVRSRLGDDLDQDILHAREHLENARAVLKQIVVWSDTKDKRALPEAVASCLERCMRGLELVLPAAQELSTLRTAEVALKRVLGAVERYADELPAVIALGKRAIELGIANNLIDQAEEHLKAYKKALSDLTLALKSSEASHCGNEETPAEEEKPPEADPGTLKDAMVKARMAGAPEELIKRADKLLHTHAFDVWLYAQKELEMRIALAEADDIAEMSVDKRFQRVQNAEYEASSLDPPLEQELMSQVEDLNVALAAERSLVTQLQWAKDLKAGISLPANRPGSRPQKRGEAPVDQVGEVVDQLRTACKAAETSALDEAKMLIPEALEVANYLQAEGPRRDSALKLVQGELQKWQGKVSDLRTVIVAAREVGVPSELLDAAYQELNTRKVRYIISEIEFAVKTGEAAVATALALRGQVLNRFSTGLDRNRLRSKLTDLVPAEMVDGVKTIEFEMVQERCGGVFGSRTWRDNPHFVIRHSKPSAVDVAASTAGQALQPASRRPSNSPRPPHVVHIAVALAEASTHITLAVHAVQNHSSAAAAGQGDLLVPGYTLLASCKASEDLPNCHFELPVDDERPVVIVPSAASGENGRLTLVVGATGPVDVVEVPSQVRNLWVYKWSRDLKWSQQRPHSKYLGGQRNSRSAPSLSWYRNPQFRVRVAVPAVEDVPEGSLNDERPELDRDGLVALSNEAHEAAGLRTGFPERRKRMPLLQAFLVPLDKRQQVPVAVHIVRNLTSRTDKVEENSMRHELLASSGIAGTEYQVGSEIGAACALPLPSRQDDATEAESLTPSSPPSGMQRLSSGERWQSDALLAEEDGADCVFVVPSCLASEELEGVFTLHLVSTTPLDIKQVH